MRVRSPMRCHCDFHGKVQYICINATVYAKVYRNTVYSVKHIKSIERVKVPSPHLAIFIHPRCLARCHSHLVRVKGKTAGGTKIIDNE